MKQQTLEKWLKLIIIGMATCGLLVYGWGLPSIGKELALMFPEFSSWLYPWLILFWITGIPCYGVLIFAWRIAGNIGRGKAFSNDNVKAFIGIYRMTALDTVVFLVGNVLLFILNLNHPGILLVSMILVFLGTAIAVCAKAMSHLVGNAAELQEESDLTI